MPCPHNQAKINAINAEITAKNTQKTKIEELKAQVDSMISNYNDCLEHLACVETNLANNSTEAGKKFDNGDVSVCVNDISMEVLDWEARSVDATNDIETLDTEITTLTNSLANYEGDCAACTAEKLAAAEEGRKAYGGVGTRKSR